MTDYKPGIYFDMPEDEYHSIPYFSRSFADDMIVDAEDAWYKSSMNPDRPEHEETPAMKLGTAIHSMLLEPDLFEDLYCKMPTPDDFEGKVILDKNDELKEFLRECGEKVTGKKEELINRAMPYIDSNHHVIWENVMASFYEDVEDHGRRILTPYEIKTLVGIKQSFDSKPTLPALLANGHPEVTIIWKDDETGVMCKCRVDYLKANEIIEVKSFSMKHKKQIFRAMCDEINYQRYNMQYLIYREAVANIIKLIKKGQAVIEGGDDEWIKRFTMTEEKQSYIVFFRTQPPYQCQAIELEPCFAKGATLNVYHTEAENLFRQSIRDYARNLERFGTDRWREEKDVEVLLDEHIPGVMYQSFNY